MARKRVTKGTTFRSSMADGNPLWKVLRRSGPESFLCEVVNEPWEHDGRTHDSDFAGHQDVFLESRILQILSAEELFDGLRQQTDDFYANLTVGNIYHYENSRGQWVRCEVVKEDTQYVLKPIALVGNWRQYDLPYRRRNGEICYPYHPSMVLAKPMSGGEVKTTFTPNEGCIYECKRTGDDPRSLPAIDLSVPPMTAGEKMEADKWKLIDDIQNICSEGHSKDNPDEILKAIETRVLEAACYQAEAIEESLKSQ